MKRSLGLLFAVSLITTACGGSGGSDNSQPFVPASDITITDANGQEVARVAYLAAAQSGESAGLVGNSGLATAPGEVLKVPGEIAKPVRIAISRIPFGPEDVPCDERGMMTISGNIRNPATLSVDDEIRIEAFDCDDGLGEVIDGVINFRVDAFSGDINTGFYNLRMDLDLIDFQVTTAEEVILSNGDILVTVNTLQSPFVSATVAGEALTLDLNGASETLVDYSTTETFDGGLFPSPYTMTTSGTLDSTQLGGTVRFSTPVMFEGLEPAYPHTGEMLIRGEGSSVRLIAFPEGVVHILIDTTGDGEPEQTIETTWDALLG
jgi:hypothetical protein